MNYGSGMVGHIADYLRYLERDYYNLLLRKEICSIIRCQAALDVIPKNFSDIRDIEFGDLAMKPEVRFIFYDKFIYGKNSKTTLRDIKNTVYETLFIPRKDERKEHSCLTEMICKADIDEFTNACIKEKFSDDTKTFSLKKYIRGIDYKFGFYFIDCCNDLWRCMQDDKCDGI